MAFFQANAVVSATPTTVLFTQLETMLTDHPAWEFVESFTESTFTIHVWKCLGSVNSKGMDFFVAFLRTTSTIGTSAISVKLAEQYDTATNLASKFAPNPGSSLTPSATDGSTTQAASLWSSATIFSIQSIITRTTAFNYMIQVTDDFITAYASPMTSVLFVGIYESYWADEYPAFDSELALARLGSTATSDSVTYTRNPAPGTLGVATASAFGGVAYFQPFRPFGSVNTVGTIDSLSQVVAVGVRFLLSDESATNRPRGELPTALLNFLYSAGVVETDTVEVGGATYVLCCSYQIGGGVWMNTEV